MSTEPGFEHTALRGITVKNMIVTIICTATIVVSVMGTYFGLKADMSDIRYNQDENYKIMDLRIRTLEDQQKLIREQIKDMQVKK